jgi:dienelactone hydrolase
VVYFKELPSWCLKLFGLLWVALLASAAPDRIEEARLLHPLPELREAKVVEIGQGEERFSALYAPARTKTLRGAVVFLPEAGWRFDSPLALGLAQYLPEHGWEVVGVQLPVLEQGAGEAAYLSLIEAASTRFKAALTWLKSRGSERLAAVGHGFGGLVLLSSLSQAPELKAAVFLSLAWPEAAEEEVKAWLEAVQVPVLDVYAEQDHPRVKAQAVRRYLLLKETPHYFGFKVSAAEHHYRGQEGLLARRIDGWLRRVYE